MKKTITGSLPILRLDSIRSRIIAFALFATLLPSISMGWLSYRTGLKVVEEKIAKELTGITSQSAREADLWLKERHSEVRVFASSYEVSENLERLSGAPRTSDGRSLALDRLSNYLLSVDQRFADYDVLAVLDVSGAVVASSVAEPGDLHLPPDWQQSARTGAMIAGAPHLDAARKEMVITLAEPVRGAREQPLGLLAARLSLRGFGQILEAQARGVAIQLHAVTRDGVIVSSTPPPQGPGAPAGLPPGPTRLLFSRAAEPLEFVNARGLKVVGALQAMRRLDWGILAEKDKTAEYAEVARVRNVTIVLLASILVGMGAAAYLLGLTLVRPLELLIRGAGRVAGGDLDVDLPVTSGGEVGYLTVVFNRMVGRLRKAREEVEATNRALLEKNQELHQLSITDGLTGLHNRTHMNETVAGEFGRAERYGHPVSVLMMDIDRFKAFNDSKGHQAGDEVLRGLANLLRETLRGSDYAARYGGEEFLILLPDTGRDEALRTAERICRLVEEGWLGHTVDGAAITVSVGVASYPDSGTDAESVIREADLALYRAKGDGRNRVVGAPILSAIEARRPS